MLKCQHQVKCPRSHPQHGRSQANWKNTKMKISLAVLSQLLLMLDILIRQFVCIEFSDGPLPIRLKF